MTAPLSEEEGHEDWFRDRPPAGAGDKLAGLSSARRTESEPPQKAGLLDAPPPAGGSGRLRRLKEAEAAALVASDADQLVSDGRVPFEPADDRRPEDEARAPSRLGANAVLASLVLLVVIRFFTEVVPVLPRFANFIDIPILAAIALLALLRRPAGEGTSKLTPIVLLGFGFVLMCALSTLTNLTRVDLAPALVFIYGFLGPIGLFFAVHSLWPVGSALRLSRVLVGLCLLQIAVVVIVDLPLFLSKGNPDDISGTFGENPYQLVFFLLVAVGLLAGIFTFEKRRTLVVRFTPFLLFAILAVIFLAQYRSLLVTTALVVILLGALLSSVGFRGVLVVALAGCAMLGTFLYAVENIPGLKFGKTIDETRADPTLYVGARLETFSVIDRVFGDTPRFAITGTGPGTYSSRAWRTFAVTSDSQSDVAGDYVLVLTQGRPYRTDVSDKYVAPQLRNQVYVGGSTASTRPFASYLSLLAEVGVVGFLLLVAVYVWAFVRSARMAMLAGRTARPGDPVPALFCASAVAFFVLLQMGTLDNWLEVTRITFIAWIVLAVATKEFDGRKQVDA